MQDDTRSQDLAKIWSTLAGVTPISTLDLEHRPTTKYQIRSHCFEDVSHYTELEIHASDGYSKNYESKTS